MIMTSRDAICFLGSRIIQLWRGVKRSTAKQRQRKVFHFFFFTADHVEIRREATECISAKA